MPLSFPGGSKCKRILDVVKSRIGTIAGGSVTQSKDKFLIENTDIPYFWSLDEVHT